ncbi:unnamed protein product [Prunus armeniaca]
MAGRTTENEADEVSGENRAFLFDFLAKSRRLAAGPGWGRKRMAALSFWYWPRQLWWPDKSTADQNVAGCSSRRARGERETRGRREREMRAFLTFIKIPFLKYLRFYAGDVLLVTSSLRLRFESTTCLRTHLTEQLNQSPQEGVRNRFLGHPRTLYEQESQGERTEQVFQQNENSEAENTDQSNETNNINDNYFSAFGSTDVGIQDAYNKEGGSGDQARTGGNHNISRNRFYAENSRRVGIINVANKNYNKSSRQNAKTKHSASASLSTSLPLLGFQYIDWNPNRCADEYLDGIEDFIEFARRHNPGATRIRCPCRRCNNTLWETIENVGFHLVRNGMIETYSIWNLHGEQLEHASSSNATRVDNVQPIVDANDEVMDIIQDVFPFASTNMNQEEQDDVPTPIDSAEFEQYEKLLKNANQELYPGCESFSVLTAIVELMHGKIKYRMSNLCFDYFLGVFKRMLPTDNCLPKDHKQA